MKHEADDILERTVALDNVFPQVNSSDVDRWDREWMHYFATEDRIAHLVESRKLKLLRADLGELSERQVFDASLTGFKDGSGAMTALHVWVKGADLVGRRVLEIGCGCGWLGKQLGLVCEQYVGIDYSQVALAIARGNSPASCRYLHISEQQDIAALAGQMDLMVGREFFIHQNFDNARWVLGLGAFLLRPGGTISADFYMPNPKIRQGVVHGAKSPLDPKYASCAFHFQPAEIREVAGLCGLEVLDMTEDLGYQRRFVTLRKP